VFSLRYELNVYILFSRKGVLQEASSCVPETQEAALFPSQSDTERKLPPPPPPPPLGDSQNSTSCGFISNSMHFNARLRAGT
jgi:hypothetical protein